MFPKPFEKYIPTHWKRTPALLSFAAAVDKMVMDTENEIFGLSDLLDPEKCPSKFLDYLGSYINAGLQSGYSDLQKRIKIVRAVQGHKIRGSFTQDAKPKIDNIAGGNSVLITQSGGPGWMFESNENSESVNLAIFDSDNTSGYGFDFFSESDILGWPGNIFIDVDNSILTTDEQKQIKLDMEDIVPAYMFVHFGYFNGSGVFVEYFILPE